MFKNFESVRLTKKNKRKVSAFVAGELLYDYKAGVLDDQRQTAVAECIQADHSTQRKYKKLISALSYADELSQTQVPEDVVEKIMIPSGYFETLIAKMQYDHWPKVLKIGLETALVVFMMVCVLAITPWEKVTRWISRSNQNEVILAEIARQKTAIGSIAEIEKRQDTSVTPFVDEGLKSTTKVEKNEQINEPQRKIAEQSSAESLPKSQDKKIEPQAKNESNKNSIIATGPGFLYRGEIEVTNLEVIGPKVAEAIKELGGRKAGNVEIGWKKPPNSRYFHFVIPEAKYPELISLISLYGFINFRKEKHSRLMPEGIIRIIMTMDEKKNDKK